MFDILSRRILQYKLNMLIPKSGFYIFLNDSDSWKIGPRSGRAEALIHHSLYNKTVMDELLVADYKYIALAREPVSWFFSAVGFYKDHLLNRKLLHSRFTKKHSPFRSAVKKLRSENFGEGIRQPEGARSIESNNLKRVCKPVIGQTLPALASRYDTHRKRKAASQSADYVVTNKSLLYMPKDFGSSRTYFHLVQLQFTGFDYRQKDNLSAINQHIASYIPNVDVIILTEVFDASLIILKRRFGWSYRDIIYTKRKVGNPKQAPTISEQNAQILLSPEVNLGEKLLYDKLNETWWKQPELKEDNFWEEVSHFSEVNLKVTNVWCPHALKYDEPVIISESHWQEELTLSLDFSWKIGPRSGRAEALIHHSLYNKTMMDELLEPD
ncbi:uncharacterized protein [Watersipora subatra]|uniref:uncharacterized protein n=1 Tax=Watersipora subatra TaxID=2589382 RepID=UPI00355BBBD5